MFERLLKKLSTELSRKKITYMVIGGQAVLIYGEPRLTKDIDITLGIGPENVKDIKNIANKIGLKVLVDNTEDFVKETMVLPTVDTKSGIRVDFIFSYTSYEKEAIKRSKKVKLGSVFVNFVSLEDLIIHKLIAKRPRDLDDIRVVLLKNPDYDKKYILQWLKKFSAALNEDLVVVFKSISK